MRKLGLGEITCLLRATKEKEVMKINDRLRADRTRHINNKIFQYSNGCLTKSFQMNQTANDRDDTGAKKD